MKDKGSSKMTIEFQFVMMDKEGIRTKTSRLTCKTSTTANQVWKAVENHARRYCKRKKAQFVCILNKPAPKIVSPHRDPIIPLRSHAPSSYARR